MRDQKTISMHWNEDAIFGFAFDNHSKRIKYIYFSGFFEEI